MSRPVFCVDFNEMVDADTVLLSATDTKADATGLLVDLREGMLVSIYMEDRDVGGKIDNLIASGVVARNTDRGWSALVRWCCRIDGDGIRSESTIYKPTQK
ncbi:hypothetical protein [Paraburkholderia tropica]|uniref:hypothetical protein n=1 Tax=Paraburkholderia tropica TaxID=92647 RepID=UPI000F54063D|nr:hypothetical protein [Paraburkholderia tropica]QNB17084.1 hypothetical protein G5S35_36740 [Paraburkholderia tropica]